MLKGKINLQMEKKLGADKKIIRGINYKSLVGAQE